jgi:hypothetical protein
MLVVVAHVDEHMRMVEGRPGADAHELVRADADALVAGIIGEMGDDGIGHGRILSRRLAGRTISGGHREG